MIPEFSEEKLILVLKEKLEEIGFVENNYYAESLHIKTYQNRFDITDNICFSTIFKIHKRGKELSLEFVFYRENRSDDSKILCIDIALPRIIHFLNKIEQLINHYVIFLSFVLIVCNSFSTENPIFFSPCKFYTIFLSRSDFIEIEDKQDNILEFKLTIQLNILESYTKIAIIKDGTVENETLQEICDLLLNSYGKTNVK